MAIENESNQMVLFINLSDLLLRNQEVEKIEKNRSFTTTDEGFLEKLRISNELPPSQSLQGLVSQVYEEVPSQKHGNPDSTIFNIDPTSTQNLSTSKERGLKEIPREGMQHPNPKPLIVREIESSPAGRTPEGELSFTSGPNPTEESQASKKVPGALATGIQFHFHRFLSSDIDPGFLDKAMLDWELLEAAVECELGIVVPRSGYTSLLRDSLGLRQDELKLGYAGGDPTRLFTKIFN
ncbi:unnamed protein product [Dovyalis caffra]|uniref:Uncharacterized protein n=1 Tax=Dovyalis caffra TaxID=77055 RepID=A0AAV1QU68_9ROSI|nr:unnamed protein product [Dovyalis caffra]CAK7328772.1 unnamed protein product [Dovyalis caffra]